MRFCDELEFSFGWFAEDEQIARTSHVVDGWLVDPVDWGPALERVGKPRGVIQLLDRHERDCAAIASRLGVPHHVVPFDGVEATPFEFLPASRFRFWREVALWWPDERVLVSADALGTLPYFRTRGEPIGVHPFLRLSPPKHLGRVWPRHVLCGHGEGIHGDHAAEAVHTALQTARRRLPAALGASVRSWLRMS